jgi:hypothetical protein
MSCVPSVLPLCSLSYSRGPPRRLPARKRPARNADDAVDRDATPVDRNSPHGCNRSIVNV